MIPTNRVSSHPGDVLLAEFLEPLKMSVEAFAHHLGVSQTDADALVRGDMAITPELAWLLGMATGTGPELWMNLQSAHDLTRTRPQRTVESLVG